MKDVLESIKFKDQEFRFKDFFIEIVVEVYRKVEDYIIKIQILFIIVGMYIKLEFQIFIEGLIIYKIDVVRKYVLIYGFGQYVVLLKIFRLRFLKEKIYYFIEFIFVSCYF